MRKLVPISDLIYDTTFEKWKERMIVDDELEPLLYRLIKLKYLAVFYHHCEYLSAGTSFRAGTSERANGAGGLVVDNIKDVEGSEPIHLRLTTYGNQWYIVKAI